MHCILIAVHPMVGLDLHMDLMPAAPSPLPSPTHPHVTAHILFGWAGIATKWTPTEKTMGIEIVCMGSDIANGIVHIPLPLTHFLLAAIMTAFSGSKSHFGPASVQTPKGPVGAALLVLVNYNLNCGTVPTPTGVVLAPNTVVAHMTLGDVIGGFIAMGVDIAVGAALNYLCGKLPIKNEAVKSVAGGVIQFLTGSPLGRSAADLMPEEKSWYHHIPGGPGTLWGYASDGGRQLGNELGDAISGAETPTDRLYGRDGAYAADQAAAGGVDQPADTSGAPNPASDITDNPNVTEF